MSGGEHESKKLFDTHCHLDLEPLCSNIDGVLQDAEFEGVNGFIVPAVGRSSWQRLRRLSERFEQVYYAVGLHPAFLDGHQACDLLALERALELSSRQCVAVGEVGMDKRFGALELQLELFEAQLALAAQYKKPVIVHSVGMHDSVARVLKRAANVSGVVHAFSGSYEQAKLFVDQGFRLGIGPVICRARGKTANAVRRLPLDSLLIETDSPDMYLPSASSKKGAPKDLSFVLECLSDLVGVNRRDLAEMLQENCEKLFFSPETREV